MSRIVIATWGSYGDVYPYVGLGGALRDCGHQVTLALPGYYRPIVEREGLDIHPTAPDVDPDDRAAIARAMDPVKGPEEIVRRWVLPALKASARDIGDALRHADLLVTHPMAFAAPALAEARGIPWVSTVLSPMSFFSGYDYPVMSMAPWLSRAAKLGPIVGRALVHLARAATHRWGDPVYALRAELGLPRGGNPLFEGQFSPLLTLALFSRVLAAPQPDWPAHVRTTGFVFYNGRDVLSSDVEAFLSAGAPPVVFTLGTSAVGAAGDFYEESARAVVALGIRAVLMVGPLPENRPRTASPDILLLEQAPHQLLLPRAAAVVHHGGVGTTGQVLRSGRPALVVPHAHDQPDNAARVVRLGTARTISPRAYLAPRVARELERLLTDGRYAAAAASVGTVVRAEGGAGEAAAVIGTLCP